MKKFVALALVVSGAAALAVSAGGTTHVRAAGVAVEHAPPVKVVAHSATLNWAGFAAYAAPSPFTTVAGSWKQPTASCSKHSGSTYAAFWVGLDGYNSTSVEQTGTDSDCTSGGAASYYAWYEMYPAAPVNLSTSQYPVQPGDAISASVNSTSGKLTIGDATSPRIWSFTTVQSFSGFALSSAEWIAEAPSLCSVFSCRVASLTNFGTVTFTGASANGQAVNYSGWKDDPLTMVTSNGRTVKAAPSGLNSAGNSFSVAWQHS
jgi:hypothetical protein